MKVVLFNGSRREKGCTYTALNIVAGELGRNMAWLLKSIEAGKQAGVPQPVAEKKVFTNFIR